MKLVTWNCNGALRNKLSLVDSLNADVYVIQECENPETSTESYRNWAGSYLWVGTSKSKGIGVFPKRSNHVRHANWDAQFSLPGASNQSSAWGWKTSDLKLFLPFVLNDQYSIVGVWTKADGAEAFQYIGQVWKFLQLHKNELRRSKSILIGDFNSNRIWDKPDRWWNHSDVVEELASIGFSSLYHHQTGDAQGQESLSTFFLHRDRNKPYHIDYAFASADVLKQSSVQIGDPDEWLAASDHLPITVEISR